MLIDSMFSCVFYKAKYLPQMHLYCNSFYLPSNRSFAPRSRLKQNCEGCLSLFLSSTTQVFINYFMFLSQTVAPKYLTVIIRFVICTAIKIGVHK